MWVVPLKQAIVTESKIRYKKVLDFCNIMNLHFEPALKGNDSTIYHASNTIQTRSICLNKNEECAIQDLKDRKLYWQSRNHDGYKTPYHLYNAERFGFKVCWFPQAVVPSLFIKRKSKIFLEKKRILKLLEAETNPKENFALSRELEILEKKKLETTDNYNTTNFLHYRYYYFDLDLKYIVKIEELLWYLEVLGLLPYTSCIVKTSVTGYHIYMRSEMIASTEHVKHWPSALTNYEFDKITRAGYVDNLLNKNPKKTGLEWYNVSLRGLPSRSRLDTIPTPIPEDAVLVNGLYYGDDRCYADFRTVYHEISKILGTDNKVFNPVAVAQLPGYTNPKHGYTANIVYSNMNAPVLTLRLAKEIVKNDIKKWYDEHTNPLFDSHKEDINLNIDNKEEVLSSSYNFEYKLAPESTRFVIAPEVKEILETKTGEVEKEAIKKEKPSKKKAKPILFTKRKMPESPEEYCFMHGLTKEVIWGDDINGHSNEMLRIFSRFAHRYINLTDSKQQKVYFENIIEPYFKIRKSRGVSKVNGMGIFFRRFIKLCKKSSKTLSSVRINEELQSFYSKSIDLQQDWDQQLKDLLGEKSSILTNKVHIKLRSIICDHIVSCGSVTEEADILKFEFQIPAAYLNSQISKYKEKLKYYCDLGFYTCSEEYVIPIRRNGKVIKQGECKKHFLSIRNKSIAFENSVLPLYTKNVILIERYLVTSALEVPIKISEIPTLEEVTAFTYDQKKDFVYDVLTSILDMGRFNLADTLKFYVKKRYDEKENYLEAVEKIFIDDMIGKYFYNVLPLIKSQKQPSLPQENLCGVESIVCDQIPTLEDISGYDDISKKSFVYNRLLNWIPDDLPEYGNLMLIQKGVIKENSEQFEKILVDLIFKKFVCGQLSLMPRQRQGGSIDVISIEKPFDPYNVVFDVDQNLPTHEKAKLYAKQWEVHTRRCKEEINKTRIDDPVLHQELKDNRKQLRQVLDTVDDIIIRKEALYSQFRELAEDRDDFNLWMFSGCLNRDNMVSQYTDALKQSDVELHNLYVQPVQLFADEASYTRTIEKHTLKILYLRNTLPIPLDYEDDYTDLKKSRSKIKYVISLLALL